MMKNSYTELFGRNLGVLTEDEQRRVAAFRVAVIGDSGTADVLATLLARSGFAEFILAGGDVYATSDMNRQIGCFADTVGRKKVSVIADILRAINPDVRLTVFDRLPAPEEMEELIKEADLVIPAMDDFPLSVTLFRAARSLGRPAILCLPAGTAGWVSVFTGGTPSLETMLGIPPLAYGQLRTVINTTEYRCAQYHYITDGDWRVDWFGSYFRGNKPLALICPVQWTVASLAVLEAVKVASGKWKPMLAPRCWRMKNGNLSASRFSMATRIHRKLGWFLFGSEGGLKRHRLTHFFWKRLFGYFRHREKKPTDL